jgi:hypothetical protein
MSVPHELPRIGDYLDHWARIAPEREALVFGLECSMPDHGAVREGSTQ